ncbi:MAG: hypothetical protein JXB34_00405 [Bacteroidales bacterium]|nr:hypothetical protein [Bacteroidales bacterium]
MQSFIAGTSNIPYPQQYGGKAAGLILLRQHGFCVPGFYIVASTTILQFIKGRYKVRQAVDEWKNSYHIDENSLWAVRSSADVEDGPQASYAGLFHTETNIPVANIAGAIEKLVSAYLSFNNNNYSNSPLLGFSIILQKMATPDLSGVIFSKNPQKPNEKCMAINLIPGLGENLVSGRFEGLAGTCVKKHIWWDGIEKTFQGQIFNGSLSDISLTGQQIANIAQPLIKELVTGATKLEKIKKHPVDIEFAISGGKLYWLQVRNITAFATTAEVEIYDNSNIGENYPGLSLPLTISFVRHTYYEAYRRMARYFGMDKKTLDANTPLFSNMTGGINGALYYNISAWQKLLYQLPFGKKTSKLLPGVLGMEPAEFTKPQIKPGLCNYVILLKNITAAFLLLRKHNKKYEFVCNQALAENKKAAFINNSHSALVERFLDIEKKLAANWLAPLLNGFFAMLFFSLLRKMFSQSRLQQNYPNFINDILFAQGDIVSVQIVRRYRQLVLEIIACKGLTDCFNTLSPELIYSKLPHVFPAFYKNVELYLNDFGARCDEGELKMETVNYSEDPVKFIALLKSGISGHSIHQAQLVQFNYKNILAKEYRLNPIKRLVFLQLIKYTLPLLRNRENYRFMRTRIFALFRSLFRAIDKQLLNYGLIDMPGDSLWLELDEILNPGGAGSYRNRILQRKQEYARYKEASRSNRYEKRGRNLIPIFQNKKLIKTEKLTGIGCCSGIVTSMIRIVTPDNVGKGNFSGFILAADFFEPGWVNIFSQAAGIISARGNLLSHTAILCREMGIPSVIGVKNLTKYVNNNDWVKMNGSTGEIYIEQNGK